MKLLLLFLIILSYTFFTLCSVVIHNDATPFIFCFNILLISTLRTLSVFLSSACAIFLHT